MDSESNSALRGPELRDDECRSGPRSAVCDIAFDAKAKGIGYDLSAVINWPRDLSVDM